jgi:PKD repeat protein
MKITNQHRPSNIIATIAVAFIMLLGSLTAIAQNPDYSKGNGTGNATTNLSGSTGRKTQLLYLPGDLVPAVSGGKIYALYFKYGTNTTGNPQVFTDFTIRIGQTNATAFTANTFFTGLNEVFNRNSYTIDPGTAGDWFKIDLPNGYTYDPTLTLIVETEFSAATNTSFNTRTSTLTGRKISATVRTNLTGTASSAWDDFGFALNFPTGPDAGVIAITNPAASIMPGLQNIVVDIRNFSNTILNSVTISGEVDSLGVIVKNLGPIVYFGPVDSFKVATGIVLDNYNFREAPYTITVRTSQPNGGLDTDVSNDEATLLLLSCSGLSGNYTINAAQGTGGTNFQSFTDVVSRLVQCGVAGPVTFNVTPNSGPYIEQITIPANITGVSATNTITFNGNNDTLKFTPTTNDRHIIKLDGADHITFTNLVIKSNSTDFGWGIHLINQADSNTISNCVIDLSEVTSTLQSNTAGIVATNSSTSVITDGNNTNYLTVTGNTIIGGYTGIRLYGQSANNSMRNLVLNNTIRDFYTYATYMRYNDSLVFAGNDVSRPLRDNGIAFYGHFLTQSKRCITQGNKIHNPFGGNLASTAASYGLYIGTSDAPIGEENLFYNNLIYNFNGGGINYGIYNSGASGAWYYHNTVSLDDQSNPSAAASYGFYQTTVESNIKFLNNIVSVSKASSANKYALFFNTPASVIESNYNGLYVNPNDATSYVGYHSATDYTTMLDWQGANSGAYDQNSQFANPVFANPNTADFTPGAGLIDNIGTPLGVATDINAQARDLVTPDPGAIEFSFAGTDAAIFYVGPLPPQNPGSYPVEVTVQNVGTVDITEVSLGYTDGTVLQTETFTGLNIAAGNSQNIVFTVPFNMTETTPMTVFISSVNTQPDLSQLNDTAKVNICVRLTGTYTIDQTQPASPTNFTSFSEAVNAMVLCEVGGPVTINVVAGTGPYSEQITIPNIIGTSAVNTVTFNGNGNEISFNSTLANRHIIRLDGAKHFTFDNLVVRTANATYGWGFHLYNFADSNTITNCTIDMSSVTSTTTDNSVGIVTTSSTSSTSSGTTYIAQGLLISNNTIIGGAQSIRLGGATASKPFFNRIVDNTILDFFIYGIYVGYQDSLIVSGNDMSRPNRSATSTGSRFIWVVSFCDNALIEKNVIHDPNGGNTFATDRTVYGIDITNLPTVGKATRVFNNVFYNFLGNSSMYGLYHGGGAEAIYYHNTISIEDNAAANTTQITAGIYNGTAQVGVVFKNNIVSINKSGDGPKYGMQVTQTTATQESDYNVIYVNTAQPNSFTGRFGSNNFTTLADWQTANGGAYDQNSKANSPMFTDEPNGDLTPTNPFINNIGTPVGITEDIAGNPRSLTNPDAGAIEFNAVGLDAGIVTLISPSLPASFGTVPVSVRIKNNLTIDVDSVRLTYTDGVVTESEMFYGLFLAENDETTVTFTQPYTFNNPTAFTVFIGKVNTSVNDFDQSNDTVTIDLCQAYSGNFTIDSTQAITATNYHSFQALANDLANCGILTPVVVTVATDTFVEQVIFRNVPGSSLTNTITFQSASGDSSQSVLSWGATAADVNNYTIIMDGASYFTFKNMSIERSGTNQLYSRVIEFQNGGSHNTFLNNILAGPTGSTNTATTQNRTTVFSAPTKSEHNRFENNWFRGNTNGFWYEGVINDKSLGTVVNNNVFENYWTSIYLINQVAPVVNSNYVTRSNPLATNTFFPISLQRVDSTLTVLKNNVNTLGAGQYGIRIREAELNPLTPGLIANNFAQTGGGTTTTNGAITIESGNSNLNIYHNTAHNSGVSPNGRALYVLGATSNINIVNNIFVNSGGGPAYYVAANAISGINISDYNNIYATGASVGFWGTAQIALSDLQTASGKDANSVSGDPLFVSETDLHVSSAIVNNNATPLALVTDDIDGDVRDVLNPDMGADEFTPPFVDLTTTTVLSPEAFTCEEASVPLTVVVYNQGNVAATDITVRVFIGGAMIDTLDLFYAGPINSLQRDTITIDNISTIGGGTFNFTVLTETIDDTDFSNDTLRTSVVINAIPEDAFFAVDFDSVCFATPASFVIDNAVQNVFYRWYDAETAGNLLTTGTTYTTPALTANDTFYVETSSQLISNVGPVNNSIGAGGFTTAGYATSGMNLTVTRGLYLDSVTVYTNGVGTVVLELSSSNNLTVFNVRSVAVSGAGMHRIPVGFYIAPGTYRLDANGSSVTGGMYRNTAGTAYPYSIPGIISINSAVGTSTYYYWFYDWKVRVPGCDAPGARVPVYAFVDSTLNIANATYTFAKNELTANFNIVTPTNQSTVTWDFGNGATGTGNNPSYTFPADGNYTVCATVENPCNTDTKCQTVSICETLDGDFTFVYNPADSVATFTQTGTGNPTLSVWDFGNGNNSTQVNPTNKYLTQRNFTVILYSQNICGVRDTVTKTLSNCSALEVDFTAVKDANGLDFDITTIVTSGTPATLSYDMGDNTTVTTANFTHTYATFDTYTITLTATNACGATDVVTQTVNACEAISALFSSSVTGVSGSDITVTFVNQSAGNGLTYDWQFSDGSSATDQNPVLTFQDGVYSATLTVTNVCGETATYTDDVNACDMVEVDFTYTAISNGLSVEFTATTTQGAAVNYTWDFGDGNTGSGSSPTHTYAAEGLYDVTVTAENACGDAFTETQNVDVITIGIGDVAFENNISVYPNPNNGLFTVTRNINADITTGISIYNTLGEQVYFNSYDLSVQKSVSKS